MPDRTIGGAVREELDETPDEGFIDQAGHYRNKWGAIRGYCPCGNALSIEEQDWNDGLCDECASARVKRMRIMSETTTPTGTIDLDALAADLTAAGTQAYLAPNGSQLVASKDGTSVYWVYADGRAEHCGDPINWTALDIIRRHVEPALSREPDHLNPDLVGDEALRIRIATELHRNFTHSRYPQLVADFLPEADAILALIAPPVSPGEVTIPRDLAERAANALDMVSREPSNWVGEVNQPRVDVAAIRTMLEGRA